MAHEAEWSSYPCLLGLSFFSLAFPGVKPGRSGGFSVPVPAVKFVAIITPFVTLTISSEYYRDGTPVVRFLCDKGPGIYEGNPLTVTITANVPVKLYCNATDLSGDGGTTPATRLSVRFDGLEKWREPFHPSKTGRPGR
jgi:hypothetical protein